MRKLLVVALLSIASRSFAQALPESPKPHLDRTEWSLLATDAAVPGLGCLLDALAISRGATEVVMPGWIANHPPVMVLYSGGIVTRNTGSPEAGRPPSPQAGLRIDDGRRSHLSHVRVHVLCHRRPVRSLTSERRHAVASTVTCPAPSAILGQKLVVFRASTGAK